MTVQTTFSACCVILHNSCNSLADYFFDLKMNMFYIILPPSQPSPKGEGA
jgi:hypothetical protein